MKKIIAIVMALVMMMAVTVPALAAELSEGNTFSDAIVKTNTSSVVGEGEYLVTYPATMDIIWETESTQFTYSVKSQLRAGKCVSVTVADKDAGYVMTSATNAELAYTLSGTTSGKTTMPVVNGASFNFNVDVAPDAWAAAAIDEYKDTLTFTSAVVDL